MLWLHLIQVDPTFRQRLNLLFSWLTFSVRIPLSRNESGRFGALKSDSTHHFFRNACTKSGSLRFSQFSGCWLILSVYILMSFDFPFEILFGVRWFCYYPYFRIPLRRGAFDTTLCGNVCQWLATGRWFTPGIPVSSINKTDRHDIPITEILLKLTLNTINLNLTCSLGFFH